MTTRERIIGAARTLFAERGYRGTSVGDVEAAAGLQPRRGALYKHFASKEELLREVIAADRGLEELRAEVDAVAGEGLDGELRLIGVLGLAELRRERDLIRIVMREGEAFPAVADAFRDIVVARSHELAATWLRERAPAHGHRVDDPEAAAAVLVGGLVGRIVEELLVGPDARGVDDARFLEAWTAGASALITSSERSAVP